MLAFEFIGFKINLMIFIDANYFQAEIMGGEECAKMKEVASSSLSEEQNGAQERLLKEQEAKQIELDLKHANELNEMKEELNEDAKIAKDSITTQMEEQKRKVGQIKN